MQIEAMASNKRVSSPIMCLSGSTSKKQKIGLRGLGEKTVGHDVCPGEGSASAKQENYDFLFNDEDDFDLQAVDIPKPLPQDANLDLSMWQRCVVESCERECRSFSIIAKVRAGRPIDKENSADVVAFATCHLQGPWRHTHIKAGDIVSLQGVWDAQLAAYKVNAEHGFCVTNPDTLIPGTCVVGSLFCRRKAVLQDRFKGIDANNKVMVIGSLVHELFQIVLKKGLKSYKAVKAAADDLLASQETAYMLYGSVLTREDTLNEVQQFVPHIAAFIEQYVEGRKPAVGNDLFEGNITQIQDIEENLWVPQLGLKGKIDVTVRVTRRRSALSYEAANKLAIPLELKTGRASFSMEHKGQVLLYQMMMSAIGRETRSGLLLYLREGIMREICGARNEQRDLIVLRNDLAHYLTTLPDTTFPEAPLELGAGQLRQPFILPEPISHHSACGNCAYATICCTFAKTDAELQLRNSHPLRKVMEKCTTHLQASDYEYFMKWCSLLTLEEKEARKSNNLRALWTETPETRQGHGRAIVNLELCGEVMPNDGRYMHSFELKELSDSQQSAVEENVEELVDFTICGFSQGEYVIVSTRTRLAVAAGFVHELTPSKIAISLERNLCKNYGGERFIVDKHDSQSVNVFNFTNLGLLLDGSERAAALRTIIVNGEVPTHIKVLPRVVANEGAAILRQLNSVQRAAVLKALTTESYFLIKGLPGTGKTQTLVAIVRLLHLMGLTVLITSHTHSAVDNLLLRLLPHQLPMLRLGASARLNPQLHACSEGTVLADCCSEAELAAKYAAYSVVGVTCLGAGHSLFLHRRFDYCIVDEATQVMQPTVLRPLFFSSKFILVGDPDQLPPLIRSREARKGGADESLFARLDNPQATAVLTLQYRMNRTIMRLANALTYGGTLMCGESFVDMATLQLAQPPAASEEKWLQRTLQTQLDQAVFVLDTTDCAQRSQDFASAKHSSVCTAIEQTFAEVDEVINARTKSSSMQMIRGSGKRLVLSKYTNYCEAAVVMRVVEALLGAGYAAERIGVIAPYRAQVELLRKLIAQHPRIVDGHTLDFAAVEVNTVDQYQGRDKDVVLYSCTKTGAPTARDFERSRDAEVLEDQRRLTVAITRSKVKLIVVGDVVCLQQYTPFRALFERIPTLSKLRLENGKLGFEWQVLLQHLTDIINA